MGNNYIIKLNDVTVQILSTAAQPKYTTEVQYLKKKKKKKFFHYTHFHHGHQEMYIKYKERAFAKQTS